MVQRYHKNCNLKQIKGKMGKGYCSATSCKILEMTIENQKNQPWSRDSTQSFDYPSARTDVAWHVRSLQQFVFVLLQIPVSVDPCVFSESWHQASNAPLVLFYLMMVMDFSQPSQPHVPNVWLTRLQILYISSWDI